MGCQSLDLLIQIKERFAHGKLLLYLIYGQSVINNCEKSSIFRGVYKLFADLALPRFIIWVVIEISLPRLLDLAMVPTS